MTNYVLLWLLAPLAGYVCVTSAYLLAVSIGAWVYRPPAGPGARKTRFAIIVPAHNEGAGIVPTLRDLRSCDYPLEGFTVIVIADNCTDDTAAVARSEGAIVLERHDLSARGKGQALDWLLRGQRELLGTHDAVVFIDADMFIDRNFLTALDAAFTDRDVDAVQAQYTIANPQASWFAAFTYMSFALVNHLRPAGRCFLGGAAGLKGSGMAFRRDLILETGWPASSIAEDLEFGKMLTLRGTRVLYVPQAAVTTNVGGKFRQVGVQQSRWEGGRMQVMREFFGPMLRQMLARPSLLVLDDLLDSLVQPLSVQVLLIVLGIALSWLAGSLALLVIFAAAAGVLVFSVCSALVQVRAPARVVLLAASSPLFMAFKLLLLLKVLILRKPKGWNRTPRDSSPSDRP